MQTDEPKLTRRLVAEVFGVSKRTIDRWKKRGLLAKPHRTISGWPYWTESQIKESEDKYGQVETSQPKAI